MSQQFSNEQVIAWAAAEDILTIEGSQRYLDTVDPTEQALAQSAISAHRVAWVREAVAGVLRDKRAIFDSDDTVAELELNDNMLYDLLDAPHRAEVRKQTRPEMDYGDLPPSTLNLHGLNHAPTAHRRTSKAERQAYENFRNFIRELVPFVDNEPLAGMVAGRLLQHASNTGSGLSASLFVVSEQGTIVFTGTRNKNITSSLAVIFAGRQRIGTAVLELFAALSDQERTEAAFTKFDYSLATLTDSERYQVLEDLPVSD